MDKLVLTDTGGFPLKLDDFLWENGSLDAQNYGLRDAIEAHLLAYGTDFIVEGCTYAAPNITAGWIMLAGELMRVDAHAGTDNFFVRTVTFDARGNKTFKDTSVNNTYEKIRGVLSGASGSLNITTALRLEDKQIQLLATSAQQFAVANIPNLPASKTTSGQFDAARIPGLDASKITTGTFASARIPNLDASKITTGIFADARIPDLDAAKITSGVFVAARLPDATQSAKGIQENANTTEVEALSSTVLTVTPGTLAAVLEQTWATATLATGWTVILSQNLRYRKLNLTTIQVIGYIQKDTTNTNLIATLPSGFRPSNDIWFPVNSDYDAGAGVNVNNKCFLEPDGELKFHIATNATLNISINAIIPINL